MQFKPLYSVLMLGLVLLLTNCRKEEFLNNKVPLANAGQSQTVNIKDGFATATLKGKGTDGDGKVIAYLWSQVSGPSNARIVNEGADSTEVRKLIAGTYLFQLMVIDNGGATGVDTVSVIVKGPSTTTIVLQPALNPYEVAIWGNMAGLDQTDPNPPELGAVSWTYGGSEIGMRSAFKFDLSSIPATAVITSAKLSLYSNKNPLNGHPSEELRANYGDDNSMLIERITTAWKADTLNWRNQPSSSTTNQVLIPKTSEWFLDLIDIDVTDLTLNMTGSNDNYGFLIRLQKEVTYNSRVFYSSRHTDATKHPKLVVTYYTN